MKLALVGDLMLGGLVNDHLKRVPPAYPWGDLAPLLADADVRVCSLGCALSDRGTPLGGRTVQLRTDARNVAVLRAVAIDAVSVANDHVLDFGPEALHDMLRLLDDAGIHRAGAGPDLAEASRPAVFAAGGLRLALLAFTDNEPGRAAGEGRPGIHYVPLDADDPRARQLFDGIRRVRADADLVLVSAHWGGNRGAEALLARRHFGQVLVEVGADIVFGHSPHALRGVEVYRGRPILYSTGDFVSGCTVYPVERSAWSIAFVLQTHGAVPASLHLHPTVIRDCQARRADGPESRAIAALMQRLCGELGTVARGPDEDGSLVISLDAGNLLVSSMGRAPGRARREILARLRALGDRAPVVVATGARGILAVRTSLDSREIVRELRALCERSPHVFRSTCRWLPVDRWVSPDLQSMKQAATGLRDRIRPGETWRITVTARPGNRLDRTEVVHALADQMEGRVDLTHPDKILWVELFGDRAALSVVTPADVFSVVKSRAGLPGPTSGHSPVQPPRE